MTNEELKAINYFCYICLELLSDWSSYQKPPAEPMMCHEFCEKDYGTQAPPIPEFTEVEL